MSAERPGWNAGQPKGEPFTLTGVRTVVFDKPLHVQVAEAVLGCSPAAPGSKDSCGRRAKSWICGCPNSEFGYRPHRVHDGSDELPRYDEDWRAIGAMIEKQEISLIRDDDERGADREPWTAFTHDAAWIDPIAIDVSVQEEAAGPTALVAACRLILVLAKAGKLKEAA